MASSLSLSIQILLVLVLFKQTHSTEDGYLRYVKDGCFIKGEALSCVKYKALKIAKKTLFGDNINSNETIKANQMISFVPLDVDTIEKLSIGEKAEVLTSEPKGFMSEWAELAKYLMKLMKDFFKVKGLRVNLPEGARTVEEDDDIDSRGKKKKLAIIVPLLTLLTAIKTKLLLIPVLLAVLLLKKLLLVGALLLPSLLNTLKACKHHHPHSYSYFGSSDASDFNSDYGSTYAYSSGAGYNKDWASNRAYNMPKYHRPTPAPVYITAPGAAK
ncbi:uncharacterized protein LOC114365143 isoform X2 [Ostrinia furnacalis]|uniref:uncharacterized protein LOC114365143 isoform X2 n=1 Tax=Ostrinia furnacalis TaxID=93504 RepID=UPI00103F2CA9|nr:uncharacterized protein LOC114365143 isoform X2 [Ostrinia furnacalis]